MKSLTFEEFLPGYLEAHADPRTRLIHLAGSAGAVAATVGAVALRKPAWLLAAFAIGYIPAWLSHWIVERNQPKTFAHPFYSLRADFVMGYRTLRG